MKKVLNADFGASISERLPFWDRGRLSEPIRASLEQNAKQRGGNALTHGPTFEGGTHAYSVAIALCNKASLPGDDEGCRQSLGGFESRVDSLLKFAVSISLGSGSFGSTSPMGQGTVSASGNLLLTTTGVKCTPEAHPTETSRTLGFQGTWLSE